MIATDVCQQLVDETSHQSPRSVDTSNQLRDDLDR